MAIERREPVPLETGEMRALLVLPDGTPPEGGWPGVVAIHDIAGFSRDIRRIARRFADSGYAAIAPALYDGAGAPPLCVVRTLGDLRRREGSAFERLEAARRFLATQTEVDAGRIGVTGFCMGGGFAIFWASGGGLRVCAPWYGETPEKPEGLDRVCPVVAGYGELDRPFIEHGRRLAAHLASLGIPHDVEIYPGVGHGYMNDHGGGPLMALMRRTPMRAGYDETAAEDSWRRMLTFFAEHL
jgi:carboxymethylenebutenolidase